MLLFSSEHFHIFSVLEEEQTLQTGILFIKICTTVFVINLIYQKTINLFQ